MFHFLDMNYPKVPQVNFSTCWIPNIADLSSKTFPIRGHEI